MYKSHYFHKTDHITAAEFDEEMMLENMSSIPPEYLSEQELKEAVANGAIVPAQYPLVSSPMIFLIFHASGFLSNGINVCYKFAKLYKNVICFN